ncbi:MAG: glycosyl transferase, partial [Burkholderiaceae bacterium]
MGDVLMTTPALRALKALPQRPHLTLLTSSAGAALAGHLPMVDDVLVYDAPWVKQPQGAGSPKQDREWIERLGNGAFDAAVIFTVFSQSPLPAALLCRLAGIPLQLAHCRENPYQLLSDRVAETEPQQRLRHEVQRQLDLVAAIGAATSDTRLAFVPRARDRAAIR